MFFFLLACLFLFSFSVDLWLSFTNNDPFPLLSFLFITMVMSQYTHSNTIDRLSQEVATALDLKLTPESTLHLETPRDANHKEAIISSKETIRITVDGSSICSNMENNLKQVHLWLSLCPALSEEKKNSYYNLGNCQTLGNSKFEFNDFHRVISQIFATCKRPTAIQTCSATYVSPGSSLLLWVTSFLDLHCPYQIVHLL